MHCKCNQVLYICAQWGNVVHSLQVEKGIWVPLATVFEPLIEVREVLFLHWWSPRADDDLCSILQNICMSEGHPNNFSTRSSNLFTRGCTASEWGSVRSLLLLGLGWFVSMAVNHGYHACISQFGTTSTLEAWSSLIFGRHLPMILKGGKT